MLTGKLITFENGSDWQKWRLKGLGGSDAPIIMGVSRFKGRFELWQEKTGQRKPKAQNEAMQRGTENEPKARDGYTLATGNFMPPAFVEAADSRSWLRASLDGLDPDGSTLLEVKCPYDVHDHLTAREGSVPEQYYPQIQHCMAVAGVPKAHYWSWWEDNGVLLEVSFDESYWTTKLLPAEEEFWGFVESKKYPIPTGSESREDDEYLAIERDVYEALAMRTVAEDRLRAAKAKLEPLLKASITKGKYLEAVWAFRKGGVVPSFTRNDSLSLSFRRIK